MSRYPIRQPNRASAGNSISRLPQAVDHGLKIPWCQLDLRGAGCHRGAAGLELVADEQIPAAPGNRVLQDSSEASTSL